MRTTALFAMAALLMLAPAPGIAQQTPPEEPDVAAYRPIYTIAQDVAAGATKKAEMITLAEAFLADSRPAFAESRWRGDVYVILYKGYKEQMNWAKALDTVDRVEKLMPKMPPEGRKELYLDALDVVSAGFKDAIRVNKLIDYAKRISAIDPKNVRALFILATELPSVPIDPVQADPVLAEIIGHGERFGKADKPPDMPADQWANLQKAIQLQTMNLVALRILNKKDFIGCAKAYEDVVKLTPKDAAAQYRLGFCYYNQVKPANDLVLEANAKLIAFVKLCNDAAEREHAKLVEFVNACNENGRTCGTDENKAMIAELTAKSEAAACASEENQKQITEFTSKQDVQNKVFEELRDKAVDALARSLAVEPTGPDAAPTRGLLETLYKTKKNAPLTLEQFVAEKKKELGE